MSINAERDENEETRLPATERLEVPAVWVVELYTPSTVSGLLDGIRRLGWEHGRGQGEGIIKWMNDVRNGRSAGWTNLGLVSTSSSPHFMRERSAELPKCSLAALPQLMSITPSLTALVIGFIMTDDAATALSGPMRANFTTFVERDPLFRRRHVLPYLLWGRSIRMGGTIHTPSFQRRDAIQKSLDEVEQQCTGWVAGHLPGVFASGLRQGLYPTAMLLLSEETKLLSEDAKRMRWLDGTAMDQWYDAWQSDEWSGALMTLPHRWREETLRIQFGSRRADAFPDRLGDSEPASNWSISQRANDLVQGLLTRWALTCLLDGYHQRLSQHRDRAAGDVRFRPIRDLQDVQRLARSEAYDILITSSEVSTLAQSRREYARDVLEMKHVGFMRKEASDLVDVLRSSQTTRSGQVERDTALLLSTVTTAADATQTISNIRIQRFLMLLTVISIVIAVVALLVASGVD